MSDHNLHPATERKAQSPHHATAIQLAVAAAQCHKPTYWRPNEPFQPHYWVLDAIIAGIERASESHPFDAITAESDRAKNLTDDLAQRLARVAATYDIRPVGRLSNGMHALHNAYRIGEYQATDRANPLQRITDRPLFPTDAESEAIVQLCDNYDLSPPATNVHLSSLLIEALRKGRSMALSEPAAPVASDDLIDDTIDWSGSPTTPLRLSNDGEAIDSAIETTVRLMTATHEDSTAQAELKIHLSQLLAHRLHLITNPVWFGFDPGSQDGDKSVHGMGILDMPAYKADQQERNERATRALDRLAAAPPIPSGQAIPSKPDGRVWRNGDSPLSPEIGASLAATRQWLAENLKNGTSRTAQLLADIARSQASEAWIVVKEHVVTHGDGGYDPRNELAYLWPAKGEVYPSCDDAMAFIRGQGLELGWVAKQIIKGDGAPAIDFGVIDKAANHQLGQQIHVGKAAINGKPLWHSNGRGRFWTGIHNDRTAQQLWDECHSVLAGLRGLAARARIVESATVTETSDGATARIDLTGGK